MKRFLIFVIECLSSWYGDVSVYSDRSILFLPLAIGKFNELYPNIKVRIWNKARIIAWNRCYVTNQTLAKHEQRHKFIH